MIETMDDQWKPIEEQWVPVGERLPRDGQRVLVTSDLVEGTPYVGVGTFYGADGGRFENSAADVYRTADLYRHVTAWMPLPPPYAPPQE